MSARGWSYCVCGYMYVHKCIHCHIHIEGPLSTEGISLPCVLGHCVCEWVGLLSTVLCVTVSMERNVLGVTPLLLSAACPSGGMDVGCLVSSGASQTQSPCLFGL